MDLNFARVNSNNGQSLSSIAASTTNPSDLLENILDREAVSSWADQKVDCAWMTAHPVVIFLGPTASELIPLARKAIHRVDNVL